MAKKGNLSIPLEIKVSKTGSAEKYSKALNRVIRNGKGDGIFFSGDQLIQIGEKLKELQSGPNGIWFLIGDTIDNGKSKKTIELIPCSITHSSFPKIYKDGNKVGYLKINSVIDYLIQNDSNVIFPNEGIAKSHQEIESDDLPIPTEAETPGGPTSQRTPPPKII
jgi:hypothetical protein